MVNIGIVLESDSVHMVLRLLNRIYMTSDFPQLKKIPYAVQ